MYIIWQQLLWYLWIPTKFEQNMHIEFSVLEQTYLFVALMQIFVK